MGLLSQVMSRVCRKLSLECSATACAGDVSRQVSQLVQVVSQVIVMPRDSSTPAPSEWHIVSLNGAADASRHVTILWHYSSWITLVDSGGAYCGLVFEREHLVIIEKCPLPIIRHRFAPHIIANDNSTTAIIEKSSDPIIIK